MTKAGQPSQTLTDQSFTTQSIRHGDGYMAHARRWRANPARGAVLYLHGIQSHGGWYEGSGSHLAEAGYDVLMPDRRGSGHNAQDRGHADSPRRLLDDVRELVDLLRHESGRAEVHVIGVSWGGKLATAAAASGVEGIASLTLVAPGVFPRVDLPKMEKVRVAWSLLADPHRTFAIPLDDERLFTSNPDRIAFVRNDPLRLRELTGAFLITSRRLDRMAQGLVDSAWRGPVHLLLAGHDPIIDNDRTRTWHSRLASNRRRLSEFADGHHTLEFDPDPMPMRNTVRDWLDEVMLPSLHAGP